MSESNTMRIQQEYGKKTALCRIRAKAAAQAAKRIIHATQALDHARLKHDTVALLLNVAIAEKVIAERLAAGERFEEINWPDMALPATMRSRYKSLARSASVSLPSSWTEAHLAQATLAVDAVAEMELKTVSCDGATRTNRHLLDVMHTARAAARRFGIAARNDGGVTPAGALAISKWRRLSSNGSLCPTVDDRGEVTLARTEDTGGTVIARKWYETNASSHDITNPIVLLIGRSDTRWVQSAIRCALAYAVADPVRRGLFIFVPAEQAHAKRSPVDKTLVWKALSDAKSTVLTTVFDTAITMAVKDKHVLVLDGDLFAAGADVYLMWAASLVVAGAPNFRNLKGNGGRDGPWRSSLLRDLAAVGHPVLSGEPGSPAKDPPPFPTKMTRREALPEPVPEPRERQWRRPR
jgi:hypothetical protein